MMCQNYARVSRYYTVPYLMKKRLSTGAVPAVFQYSHQHLGANHKFSSAFGNLLPSHHTLPPLLPRFLLTLIIKEVEHYVLQ